MYDLAIIIPVFNEEPSIALVLDKWLAMLNMLQIAFQIHVYNDGSTDSSPNIVEDYSRKYKGIVFLHNQSNHGHGPTVLRGYKENCRMAEWIFQMDADDEMGPDEFKDFWEKRQDYDFLLGRRLERQQVLSRKITSIFSRIVIHSLFGYSVYDVNSPYRLMRSSCFSPVFQSIPDNTFSPNLIISGASAKYSFRCYEEAVAHKNRRNGIPWLHSWTLVRGIVLSVVQSIKYRYTNKMS